MRPAYAIRGWGYYYRFVNSKVIFAKLDQYIWYKSLNWVKRVHKRKQTIKYYHKYFKPYPNYKIETLNDGLNAITPLTTIKIEKFVKIQSNDNPFDSIYDSYFLQRWSNLKAKKLTNKLLALMLEPCAMKVASTVLRRECHREVVFLSDYKLPILILFKLVFFNKKPSRFKIKTLLSILCWVLSKNNPILFKLLIIK